MDDTNNSLILKTASFCSNMADKHLSVGLAISFCYFVAVVQKVDIKLPLFICANSCSVRKRQMKDVGETE